MKEIDVSPEPVPSMDVQKYRESAQWDKDRPTRQVENLGYLLQALEDSEGEVLDAGAGFGRNTAFLAEQGFHVKAVEIDGGAIPDLQENLHRRNVADRVEVINTPIQEALRDIPDTSLVAIVDSGMSHYLSDEEKQAFVHEAAKKLKDGGLFTFLHFSENEPSAISTGRSKEFLQALFEDAFELVLDWSESKWTDAKTSDEHAAWTAVFRKKGVQGDVMELINRARKIKERTEQKDS